MSGKEKAVVLGGSRGIGAAIVQRLAKDGRDVVFTYHGSEEAAKRVAAETGAETQRVDSADHAAVGKFLEAQGEIGALIVNSGIAAVGDPLEQDPADIDRMIDINLRGPYHAAVEGARRMQDGGRIVFIGSVNGDRMPAPGGAAYAMTKAGLKGAAAGLARDFGARGITVNVVQPGPVDTDMNPADGPRAGMMHGAMAIGRHARPEEIAAMVAYLLSEEAAMVTGTSLNIDGGMAA